jgi:hypothetical protein
MSVLAPMRAAIVLTQHLVGQHLVGKVADRMRSDTLSNAAANQMSCGWRLTSALLASV